MTKPSDKTVKMIGLPLAIAVDHNTRLVSDQAAIIMFLGIGIGGKVGQKALENRK